MRGGYPVVALVGRTNVGKSALFNRIVGKNSSIVLDRPGVTRDYISEIINLGKKAVELIDTGGLVPGKSLPKDIRSLIHQRSEMALKSADLFVFLCDLKVGATEEDLAVARYLRKQGKPVLLVGNKADAISEAEVGAESLKKLGFGEPLKVSAIHGDGVIELMEQIDRIISELPAVKAAKPPSFRVSILGRPNVGKSSLLNALLRENRAIVSPEAGTTREAIRTEWALDKEAVELIDTAGTRKPGRVEDELEAMMVRSALAAVRKSHLALLVVDASEGRITSQDLKLLFYAASLPRSVVLVVNKTDLADGQDRLYIETQLRANPRIKERIPVIWVSCKTGKNIGKLKKKVAELREMTANEIDEEELNEKILPYIASKPLYKNRQQIKVYRIVPKIENRVHVFFVKVNDVNLITEATVRFFERAIRQHYPLFGCAVKIVPQNRRRKRRRL